MTFIVNNDPVKHVLGLKEIFHSFGCMFTSFWATGSLLSPKCIYFVTKVLLKNICGGAFYEFKEIIDNL